MNTEKIINEERQPALKVAEVIASTLFDCDTCLHFPCQKNQSFYGSIEKKMPFGNCGDHSEHGYQ